MRDFDKLVDRHAPVIIKGATADWPFPPAGQSKLRLRLFCCTENILIECH
jgi:hypothetical protein